MDALRALHTRHSIAQLQEPGPNTKQLEAILQAGLRANDHAHLRPWQFLLIEGAARNKLGELFVYVKNEHLKQAGEPALSEQTQEKLAAKPLRAPLIIVVVAKVSSHPKVPDIEQVISAGAAAQLMMVAAHAQGIGAVWRTGGMAFDTAVNQALGLEESDQIVGFLYMGTAKQEKTPEKLELGDFVSRWGETSNK